MTQRSAELASPRNWWVISGPDFSGKSTTLRALGKLGFATIPEAAMQVIDEAIGSGRTPEDLYADQRAFQYAILNRKSKAEAAHNPNTLTFLDRGMQETAAFLKYYRIPVTDEANQAMRQATYRGVFMLEQLPPEVFTADYAHTEGSEFLSKIGPLIQESYEQYGITPIRVPVMSVEERVAFILDQTSVGT